MGKWKYDIGAFVTPVVMHALEHATKMVITARIETEYADHTELWYLCSHYKLGDYIRTQLLESELSPWADHKES